MSVNIEFSWQGCYNYTDCDISSIDIEFNDDDSDTEEEISARIDTSKSSTEEQLLECDVNGQKCLGISCSIYQMNMLSVSVRAFACYKNTFARTARLDGTLEAETHAQRRQFSVEIEDCSRFEQGETYLLKVTNDSTSLKGVFTKKTQPSLEVLEWRLHDARYKLQEATKNFNHACLNKGSAEAIFDYSEKQKLYKKQINELELLIAKKN